MIEGPALLVVLLLSILFIVFMTSRVKMHAFFVLLLAALGVGLATGLPADQVVRTLKEGFGSTLASIGVVIINGTILGIVLQKTGAAVTLATFVLRLVGAERSPVAMAVTGYVAGLPIFCDSGFVVLSPLNNALAAESKQSMTVMAVALAIPLYVIHCLVPPHPGPAAAAGVLGANVGTLMLVGFLVGIPALFVGIVWATRFASRYHVEPATDTSLREVLGRHGRLPSLWLSLLPIALPLILIGLAAVSQLPTVPLGDGPYSRAVAFLGDPTIALTVGVISSLALAPKLDREVLSEWIGEGVAAAGPILAITGAGGAFGHMLRATPIGDTLGQVMVGWGIGLLLPFLLAAALKTAQGSSTVSVITTSSLMAPLMGQMGFESSWGVVLVMLAMGAGSMVVSHANDSYFWVVSRFSNLDVATAYKTFSTATFLAGVTTLAATFILHALVM